MFDGILKEIYLLKILFNKLLSCNNFFEILVTIIEKKLTSIDYI